MDNFLMLFGVAISATLLSTAPLLLSAMGSCASERSGVVNLGIEGMMSVGASVAAIATYFTHNSMLGFFCGAVAGMIMGLLLAFVCISLHADQTIAGTAINLLGPGLAVFLCRVFFNGAPFSKPLDITDKPLRMFAGVLTPGTPLYNIFGGYIIEYLVFFLAFLVWFVFYKTKFGYHLQACGEHPAACESVGIDVYKVRYICVMFSGFMAGLGGAFISLAVVSQFRAIIIVGQGFIAISAVIFGKYNPKNTALACLLFGACDGIKSVLSSMNIVSPDLISLIPYVVTILVLIFFVKEGSVPAANGKIYYKSK